MCAKSLYIFLVTDVNVGNRMDQASIVVVRGGKAYKKGPAQEKKKWSSSYTPSTYNIHTKKERKKKNPSFFSVGKEKVGGG